MPAPSYAPGQQPGRCNYAGSIRTGSAARDPPKHGWQFVWHYCLLRGRSDVSCEVWGGAIVGISSAAARLESANAYLDCTAAKSGVDALTVGMSKELAAEIRGKEVSLGTIWTQFRQGPDLVASVVSCSRSVAPGRWLSCCWPRRAMSQEQVCASPATLVPFGMSYRQIWTSSILLAEFFLAPVLDSPGLLVCGTRHHVVYSLLVSGTVRLP